MTAGLGSGENAHPGFSQSPSHWPHMVGREGGEGGEREEQGKGERESSSLLIKTLILS